MTCLPLLSDVLDYDNCTVIDQYCIEHPLVSRVQAELHFKDLLAWLWLCVARLQRNLKTHLIQPLNHLDSMWHFFILNTRSYHEFCKKFFNDYLHHEINSPLNDYELSDIELAEYLSDCYDSLGESWVTRNFKSILSAVL